jgi:hypothetical protein
MRGILIEKQESKEKRINRLIGISFIIPSTFLVIVLSGLDFEERV